MTAGAGPRAKKFVFDFGGVVFRWQPARLLRRALPRLATDDASAALWVDRIFQGYQGDWGDYDLGRVGTSALVQRIATRTGLHAGEVQGVVDAVAEELQPVPDTVDLLRRLQGAGRELHFLSNMPLPLAAHLEATHDILGCFRSGVFSGREGVAKPDPAIYALAAQRFQSPPQDLVFLDDHATNVQAARALGWHALHFTAAPKAEAEMRRHGWL